MLLDAQNAIEDQVQKCVELQTQVDQLETEFEAYKIDTSKQQQPQQHQQQQQHQLQFGLQSTREANTYFRSIPEASSEDSARLDNIQDLLGDFA